MKKLIFSILLSGTFLGLLIIKPIQALECGEPLKGDEPPGVLDTYISSCAAKLSEISGQKKTLSQAISYLNTQIVLTQAKIASTQKELDKLNIEIADLTGKINSIDYSLTDLTKLFVARVRETYIRQEKWTPAIILQANSISEAIRRTEYEQRLRDRDREIMIALEKSRLDYDNQKSEKEAKQLEVETLKKKLDKEKANLSSQKASKDQLLAVTKNDEKRYKALLDEAAAELNALLTSKFSEKRNVKKGETIGIMGSTGNSSGPHLHFGLYNLKEGEAFNYYASLNPLDYLAQKTVLVDNTACDDVTSGAVTKTLGNGSHDWPMDNIRVTQCWGHTPWSFSYKTNLHDGLDIVDPSKIVRATDDGVAYVYRGSSAMGNNVRVFHPDGKMTLYLHLQ